MRAFLPAVSVSLVACAGVLGLEERGLVEETDFDARDASPSTDDRFVVSESEGGPLSGGHGDDAGGDADGAGAGQGNDASSNDSAPPPAGACTDPGPLVYAFNDTTNGWRYSTNMTPPTADYTLVGPVFRLASPTFTGATKVDLFEIVNGSTGDAALTVVPTEGSTQGYGPTLVGKIYVENLAGTREINRYYRELPTRHRVFFSTATPAEKTGWMPEPNKTWFVCPP